MKNGDLREAMYRESVKAANLQTFGVKGRVFIRLARKLARLCGISYDRFDEMADQALRMTPDELRQDNIEKLDDLRRRLASEQEADRHRQTERLAGGSGDTA